MAHHLAELVIAAKDDTSITVEQRATIIETILDVWARRRSAPGAVPAIELDHVYAALDRLGDDRPWRFSRLMGLDGLPTSDREAPLIALAVGLERLSRETAIALLWRAFEDGIARDASWIAANEAIGGQLGDDLLSATRNVQRRLRSLAGEEGEPGTEGTAQSDGHAEVVNRLKKMSKSLSALATALEDELQPPTTP